MRDRTTIYDHLLRVQAELSFGLEQIFFQSRAWQTAKHVVDLGCGNAAFTKMLADENPEKIFTALEINEDLAALISKRYRDFPAIEPVHGTYTDLPESFNFDFLLLRHTTSYLTNRRDLFKWVSQHSSEGAAVLIIDADDDNFYLRPRLPIFSKGLEKFRETVDEAGGQRDVRKDINNELAEFGFKNVSTQRIVVHSALPNIKEKMYVYMCLVAEWDNGSPLLPDLAEELFSWVVDRNSYVQYGLFGSLFIHENQEYEREGFYYT